MNGDLEGIRQLDEKFSAGAAAVFSVSNETEVKHAKLDELKRRAIDLTKVTDFI